ncbi:hypothetical protein BS47DRAFT_695736 [Hydnum rufescens UP504]|uniref:Uncharacterized protein n=1 Tax=Hydnum rufescens UP504 TaxID=1448309 RepID=A0A9P6DI31_9AGAM|nr:hypothetical protein BS47DRAFT_695736 [Hydnum rufescens UP504]
MIMHSGRNYTPLVGRRLSNRRSLSVDTLGPEYDSSALEPSPVVNRDHIKVSPPVSLDTPMHPMGHQPVAGVFNAAEEVTGDATMRMPPRVMIPLELKLVKTLELKLAYLSHIHLYIVIPIMNLMLQPP